MRPNDWLASLRPDVSADFDQWCGELAGDGIPAAVEDWLDELPKGSII